ncbi:MAG TPA: 2-phospho-L-lactate guanylyltransferase [Alphaproteobacteria bacterium]|nr:2-phospho-L-lactate guanylyltransferase [Alphaproteobacteria bacterium]
MKGGDRFWAVVPCKDLSAAKQRLALVLSPAERRSLACAMLEDVLAALTAVARLAGVAVITRDPDVAVLARRWGVRLLADLRHEGPNPAVTSALRSLAADGASGILAIPADVPLVTSAEIEAIMADHGKPPAVTVVPALADLGTNAIACSPADAIPLCFGPRSYVRHRNAARARGINAHTLRLPGLGLDLDRPDDLLTFAAEASPTRSYALLQSMKIMERLDEGEGSVGITPRLQPVS